MPERDTVIGSVSICPLYAGIDSKLMNLGSCSFHWQVAQFFETNIHILGGRTPNSNHNPGNPHLEKIHISVHCIRVICGCCPQATVLLC